MRRLLPYPLRPALFTASLQSIIEASTPLQSGLEAWTQHWLKVGAACTEPPSVVSSFVRTSSWRTASLGNWSSLKEDVPAALLPFLAHNAPTPPVRLVEGMPPPTALSYLRRRGPPAGHGALHRAFRQRQVRVFDGHRVKRVSSSRVLSPGDVLLYPRDLAPAGGPEAHRARPASSGHAETPPAPDLLRQEPLRSYPQHLPSPPPPHSHLPSPPSRLPTDHYPSPPCLTKLGASGQAPYPPPSQGPGPLEPQQATAGKGGAYVQHPQSAWGPLPQAAHSPPQRLGAPAAHLSPMNSRASAEPWPPASAAWGTTGTGAAGMPHRAAAPAAWAPAAWAPVRDDPFMPRPALAGRPLTPGLVRSWVLGYTKELVFINKPFGLMVQGYKNTLEAMMDAALKVHPNDDTPRLVHRLDRNVSGVMAVARSAEAAAWLAACFRDKASQVTQRSLLLRSRTGSNSSGSRSRSILLGAPGAAATATTTREVPVGMSVTRVYWAIVASSSLPQGREGRMRAPVLVEGRRLPALTYYRVRRVSQGLAWVELTPQTGRRHQLRNHCARVLKAPIVGDVRYGYKGVMPSKPLARALPPSFWVTFSPRTAQKVLNPPSRKERRQAAAAAARARVAAANPGMLHGSEEEEMEEEMEEETVAAGKEVLGEGGGDSSLVTEALDRHKEGCSKDTNSSQTGGSAASKEDSSSREGGVVEMAVAGPEAGPRRLERGGVPLAGFVAEPVPLSRAEHVQQAEREVPLLLHARALIIQRPGKRKRMCVTAPLPTYMAAIFAASGWPLPHE